MYMDTAPIAKSTYLGSRADSDWIITIFAICEPDTNEAHRNTALLV